MKGGVLPPGGRRSKLRPKNLEIMYPPPMISRYNMRSKGGVHDLQILSWENVIEFSQDPPGSLPVDSSFVRSGAVLRA